MSDITIGQQILSTTFGEQNNTILINVGDILSDDGEAAYCEQFGQVGFYSLPPDPVPGQSAAEVVLLKNDDGRKNNTGLQARSQSGYLRQHEGRRKYYVWGWSRRLR